jgi:hypothetical protein
MNSTVSGNSAGYSGGGIATSGGAIGNTILNYNPGGNIDGTITSQGYNISSDDGGGNLNGPGDQINTDRCLVRCKTTAALRSRMRCCPAARRLTRAIRILPRRHFVTSAALATIACSVAASMSVQSRLNPGHAA